MRHGVAGKFVWIALNDRVDTRIYSVQKGASIYGYPPPTRVKYKKCNYKYTCIDIAFRGVSEKRGALLNALYADVIWHATEGESYAFDA